MLHLQSDIWEVFGRLAGTYLKGGSELPGPCERQAHAAFGAVHSHAGVGVRSFADKNDHADGIALAAYRRAPFFRLEGSSGNNRGRDMGFVGAFGRGAGFRGDAGIQRMGGWKDAFALNRVGSDGGLAQDGVAQEKHNAAKQEENEKSLLGTGDDIDVQ